MSFTAGGCALSLRENGFSKEIIILKIDNEYVVIHILHVNYATFCFTGHLG